MSSPRKSTNSPGRMPVAPCLRLWSPLSLYLEHNSGARGKWMVTERDFPGGDRERVISPTPYSMRDREPAARTTCERQRVGARAGGTEPEVRAEAWEKSRRRAARKLKRLARYEQLNVMVTLSFPGEGVHVYQESYRLISEFMHDHGELVDRGGAYVAVAEWHPGGHGSHWHVLVRRGRFSGPELRALREGWTSYLKGQGYVPSGGATWIRTHVKVYKSARTAANYAGKYLTKSIGEGLEAGRQRYLRSEGMIIPEPVRVFARSLRGAFAMLPHPLLWDNVYSGIPRNEPWYWVGIGPPG